MDQSLFFIVVLSFTIRGTIAGVYDRMIFDETGNPSGMDDVVEVILPQRAPAPSGPQDLDILPQVPLMCRIGEFRALDHDHRPVCIPKPVDWVDCPPDQHHVLSPQSGKPTCVPKSVQAICTVHEVEVCNDMTGECWCEPNNDNTLYAHGDVKHPEGVPHGSGSNFHSSIVSVFLMLVTILYID